MIFSIFNHILDFATTFLSSLIESEQRLPTTKETGARSRRKATECSIDFVNKKIGTKKNCSAVTSSLYFTKLLWCYFACGGYLICYFEDILYSAEWLFFVVAINTSHSCYSVLEKEKERERESKRKKREREP